MEGFDHHDVHTISSLCEHQLSCLLNLHIFLYYFWYGWKSLFL